MNERLDPPNAQGPSGWTGASWQGSKGNGGTGTATDATPRNSLERFLGGSPAAVFLRLLLISLIVGALLMWLDIRPMDVFYALNRFINRLWNLGFDAIREVAQYVLVGAVIVVPIWLVMRIFNSRGGTR
ncbi:MAG: uncharacterized protein JWO28_3099 [Hyphomicrobiales bacterium]|jgi:hypothetical protein|nr:uncharacterized protein [Hyphomicrobiales bacterium]